MKESASPNGSKGSTQGNIQGKTSRPKFNPAGTIGFAKIPLWQGKLPTKMGNIIKQVRSGGKVDIKNWYVWFKNNCPLNGPLYDDFRFARLYTGDVQMTIQISCCWNKHRYSVWGRRGEDKEFEHEKPLFETDSLRELVKWLNSPWED